MRIIRFISLSDGLLLEASPTCFWAPLTVSRGYAISVLRHQMQLHLVHSLQLIHQLLPLLLRAQKQTSLKQELHRCSTGAVSAVSGPDSKSTEPACTGLLYGVYGPVPGPARRGSKQCAKPALARFVTLLQRLCRTVVPRCQASLNRGTA